MPKRTPQPKLSLSYDSKANRYRNSRGQFVARSAVLDVRDKIVRDTESKLVGISEQFRDGKISLAEWQTTFKDTIRAAHTLAAGIAMGGKANMTPADWGRVGAQLRVQYEALNNFGLQLEAGRAMNMGRVRQYARAVRSTFLNAERLRLPADKLARWVRTRVESCAGCIEQASRGRLPQSRFPPIGSQQCRQNCGCFLDFSAK